MNLAPQTVTKLEAASRQLREATVLFFEQRDLVSIHTLAAASLQIYADVGKSLGVKSMLKHGLFIREEKKKLWFSVVNEAQNFFKHADSDPTASLSFKPDSTPYYILDAVQLQVQVEGKISIAGNCFLLWFYIAYPGVLDESPLQTFALAARSTGISATDYSSFLNLIHESEAQAN